MGFGATYLDVYGEGPEGNDGGGSCGVDSALLAGVSERSTHTSSSQAHLFV